MFVKAQLRTLLLQPQEHHLMIGTSAMEIQVQHNLHDIPMLKQGTYTVKLTANSAYGCSTVETTTATVNDLPTAGFNNSTVCLGNATSFTNTSSISSGTLTYSWNFGDGSTSTATSPSHTYSSAGNYTVTLMATANGCSNSYTTTVVVE